MQIQKTNYKNWIIEMKALLSSLDYWNFVDKGYTKPKNEVILTNQQKVILQDLRKRGYKTFFIT